MKRLIRRHPLPAYPGFRGDVKSAEDFARCGVERRMAILASLARLMELYTRNLARADERLAEAARAVADEQERIADERSLLASIASTYLEFSQVAAQSALEAAAEGKVP